MPREKAVTGIMRAFKALSPAQQLRVRVLLQIEQFNRTMKQRGDLLADAAVARQCPLMLLFVTPPPRMGIGSPRWRRCADP